MDGRDGDEDDVLGAGGGGVPDGRGVGIIFLVHFPSSFLKPILVSMPVVLKSACFRTSFGSSGEILTPRSMNIFVRAIP